MLGRKKHPFIFIFNILLFLVVILLHGSVGISLGTGHARVFLLLPVLTAFSAFASPAAAAVTGFLCGCFIDSMASGSYCFNTVTLLVLSVAVCVLANSVFNKNLKAVTTLCLMYCVVYFFLYWLIFIANAVSAGETVTYLMQYALLSAIYSAVFVIPFFFLYRYFDKIKNG